MGVPKNFRKSLDLIKSKVGPERRQEILDGIANQGTYLPRPVDYADMDSSFIEFVNKDLELIIDGKRVPVIFLTLQRWKEFARTWKFSDIHKDIKLPFITIVRQPNPQVGTNQNNWWNIPGRRNYVYMKVPTWDGNRKGMDIYKIPQPTSVDITYEVRFFTNRMKELNEMNELVQVEFDSRQAYVYPNGHPMPIHLESIGDESNISNFQERRFYVQPFEFKLLGHILREEDMEVKPAINRALVLAEISDTPQRPTMKAKADKDNSLITYNFVFKQFAENSFTFNAEYDLKLKEIVNVENISNIRITVNGSEVFNGIVLNNPIVVNAGDTIGIEVTRNEILSGKFTMFGELV
jgi:hypothetical protein